MAFTVVCFGGCWTCPDHPRTPDDCKGTCECSHSPLEHSTEVVYNKEVEWEFGQNRGWIKNDQGKWEELDPQPPHIKKGRWERRPTKCNIAGCTCECYKVRQPSSSSVLQASERACPLPLSSQSKIVKESSVAQTEPLSSVSSLPSSLAWTFLSASEDRAPCASPTSSVESEGQIRLAE